MADMAVRNMTNMNAVCMMAAFMDMTVRSMTHTAAARVTIAFMDMTGRMIVRNMARTAADRMNMENTGMVPAA